MPVSIGEFHSEVLENDMGSPYEGLNPPNASGYAFVKLVSFITEFLKKTWPRIQSLSLDPHIRDNVGTL
jgi:hypothetical protein